MDNTSTMFNVPFRNAILFGELASRRRYSTLNQPLHAALMMNHTLSKSLSCGRLSMQNTTMEMTITEREMTASILATIDDDGNSNACHTIRWYLFSGKLSPSPSPSSLSSKPSNFCASSSSPKKQHSWKKISGARLTGRSKDPSDW